MTHCIITYSKIKVSGWWKRHSLLSFKDFTHRRVISRYGTFCANIARAAFFSAKMCWNTLFLCTSLPYLSIAKSPLLPRLPPATGCGDYSGVAFLFAGIRLWKSFHLSLGEKPQRRCCFYDKKKAFVWSTWVVCCLLFLVNIEYPHFWSLVPQFSHKCCRSYV